MSQFKERKERDCLNCGTVVQGRFCHFCGQENVNPRESVWELISHFFKDITHFDGKFFSTLKYLMLRPGFLAKEYMKGRRARYVNPIRMYIFTSAFFFLIFFNLPGVDDKPVDYDISINNKHYKFSQIDLMDSLSFDVFTREFNKDAGKKPEPMSRVEFRKYLDSAYAEIGVKTYLSTYKSKTDYDAALNQGKIKHNWFVKKLVYKLFEINEKYRYNTAGGIKNLFSKIIHSLPQMFFISLPLFAIWLKLLYRRRKAYYYVDHGIFSLHFYIFSFITMLFLFGLSSLNNLLNWKLINAALVIISTGIFFYLYKAMRKFYQQRRAKTIFKFLILCFLLLFSFVLLFLIFGFFSFFKL